MLTLIIVLILVRILSSLELVQFECLQLLCEIRNDVVSFVELGTSILIGNEILINGFLVLQIVKFKLPILAHQLLAVTVYFSLDLYR